MSELSKTISIHLDKRRPWVMGESSPRKDFCYEAHLLLDDDDFTLKQDKKTVHYGGLLHGMGSSWEEALKTLWHGLQSISQQSGWTLDEMLQKRSISREEWRARLDGYNHGCKVGKAWAFSASDIRIFAKAIASSPGYLSTDQIENLSDSFARDVFKIILSRLGVDVEDVPVYGLATDAADSILVD